MAKVIFIFHVSVTAKFTTMAAIYFPYKIKFQWQYFQIFQKYN